MSRIRSRYFNDTLMNFADYLLYTKQQLVNVNGFRLIRIVLGNESCDLDSTISACIYAYFLHQIAQTCDVLHLPVLNSDAKKFNLRTENRWFLQKNVDNLIFIDDIDLDDLFVKNKLEVVLVDQNYLSSNLNQAVIEIIDHHQIRHKSILMEKNPSAVNIELVGSCCTLIAEKLLEATDRFTITDQVATLLTGPILFDTVNFSSKVGRATEKDFQIYTRLKAFRESPVNDDKLFEDLRRISMDMSELKIRDLLQKDAKLVGGPPIRLVMSSLPIGLSVQEFIQKIDTQTEIEEFLTENQNADGIIITSIESLNTGDKRQLGIFMRCADHLSFFKKHLSSEELELGLEELVSPKPEIPLVLFDQHNVVASRKFILPFLEKVINGL